MPDHRLIPLKKIELQFHYSSGAALANNPAFRGIPDSVLLNRGDLSEVLKKFANEQGNQNLLAAKEAEPLTQRFVPTTNVPTHTSRLG